MSKFEWVTDFSETDLKILENIGPKYPGLIEVLLLLGDDFNFKDLEEHFQWFEDNYPQYDFTGIGDFFVDLDLEIEGLQKLKMGYVRGIAYAVHLLKTDSFIRTYFNEISKALQSVDRLDLDVDDERTTYQARLIANTQYRGFEHWPKDIQDGVLRVIKKEQPVFKNQKTGSGVLESREKLLLIKKVKSIYAAVIKQLIIKTLPLNNYVYKDASGVEFLLTEELARGLTVDFSSGGGWQEYVFTLYGAKVEIFSRFSPRFPIQGVEEFYNVKYTSHGVKIIEAALNYIYHDVVLKLLLENCDNILSAAMSPNFSIYSEVFTQARLVKNPLGDSEPGLSSVAEYSYWERAIDFTLCYLHGVMGSSMPDNLTPAEVLRDLYSMPAQEEPQQEAPSKSASEIPDWTEYEGNRIGNSPVKSEVEEEERSVFTIEGPTPARRTFFRVHRLNNLHNPDVEIWEKYPLDDVLEEHITRLVFKYPVRPVHIPNLRAYAIPMVSPMEAIIVGAKVNGQQVGTWYQDGQGNQFILLGSGDPVQLEISLTNINKRKRKLPKIVLTDDQVSIVLGKLESLGMTMIKSKIQELREQGEGVTILSLARAIRDMSKYSKSDFGVIERDSPEGLSKFVHDGVFYGQCDSAELLVDYLLKGFEDLEVIQNAGFIVPSQSPNSGITMHTNNGVIIQKQEKMLVLNVDATPQTEAEPEIQKENRRIKAEEASLGEFAKRAKNEFLEELKEITGSKILANVPEVIAYFSRLMNGLQDPELETNTEALQIILKELTKMIEEYENLDLQRISLNSRWNLHLRVIPVFLRYANELKVKLNIVINKEQ